MSFSQNPPSRKPGDKSASLERPEGQPDKTAEDKNRQAWRRLAEATKQSRHRPRWWSNHLASYLSFH